MHISSPTAARETEVLLIPATDSFLDPEGRLPEDGVAGGIDRARSRSRAFQTLSFARRVSLQALFRQEHVTRYKLCQVVKGLGGKQLCM